MERWVQTENNMRFRTDALVPDAEIHIIKRPMAVGNVQWRLSKLVSISAVIDAAEFDAGRVFRGCALEV